MAEKKYSYYRDRVNPEDEDVPAVLARLLRWVDRVTRRHAGQTVIGVTHGDPAMMLRLHFLGQEVTMETLGQKELYPAKGSITRLVFTGAGPARDQRPAVTYLDPSAAEHKALEEAAEAARAAREQEQAGSAIPPSEAPLGTAEEAAVR
jgi:broad specificity phosphatase PhoE